MQQVKLGGFSDLRLIALSFGQTVYLHLFIRDGEHLFMLREIDMKILRRSKYVDFPFKSISSLMVSIFTIYTTASSILSIFHLGLENHFSDCLVITSKQFVLHWHRYVNTF